MLGPGFGVESGRVCIVKSLYGLITSAHDWFGVFTLMIRDFGFEPSKIMPCLWYKKAKDGKSYDYLSHHVDNFLLISNKYCAFMAHLKKRVGHSLTFIWVWTSSGIPTAESPSAVKTTLRRQSHELSP